MLVVLLIVIAIIFVLAVGTAPHMHYVLPGQSPSNSMKPFRPHCAGFSLVEVVLAIGIIAFAFVPLMALLPLGLDTSRKAVDATVEAYIAQQLTTEAQQMDFSVLISPATSTDFTGSGSTSTAPMYFDSQGNKTSKGGAIYEAGFAIAASTSLPSGITTQKLATVTIYILNITSNRTSQNADPSQNPDWKTITVLIPDNGR
jgi:uncharacterized protein (TIGR02598 family)